jgi:hypothetical protein
MAPITTKAKMYEHYRAGRFGNTLRTWPDYFAMASGADVPARIGLRYSGPAGGGYTAYDMTETEALIKFKEFCDRGADPNKLVWCEAAPDQHLILQGEICQDVSTGYALHWSPFKAQMKIALAKDPRNHNGPGALLICKSVMDESSYGTLRELLDDFPDHVVEFSVYKVKLGSLRRNTVFWEVRKY